MNRPPSAFTAVALVLSLWVAARIVWEQWPDPAQPEAVVASGPVGLPVIAVLATPSAPPPYAGASAARPRAPLLPERPESADLAPPAAFDNPSTDRLAAPVVKPEPIETAAVAEPLKTLPGPIRMLTSAWIVYRGGGGTGSALASGGQLGASQAGARVRAELLALGRATSLGGNLRASMPLSLDSGREAAVGLSVRREGRVSGEVLIERRIGLDRGARDTFAVIAAAGTSEIALFDDILLSAYGQAGFVGLRSRRGFVDGAVRVGRRVAQVSGIGVDVDLNARGAVQPGLSRIDIGPGLSVPFRLGAIGTRFSLEWRHRVAGQARPATGPAVTLGADF